MAIGAIVNSALYLAAVFIAGFVSGNDVVWKLDIAAIGLTYLSYMGNLALLAEQIPNWLATAIVALSILAGAAAGIALLF